MGGRQEAQDPACCGVVLWRSKEPTVSPQHKRWAAQLALTAPRALHRCPHLPTPISTSSQSNSWLLANLGTGRGQSTGRDGHLCLGSKEFSAFQKRGRSPCSLECCHQLRHLHMPIAQHLQCWVDAVPLFSPLSGERLCS